MKVIGRNTEGNLTVVEFSGIELERYSDDKKDECHLLLRGYNYQFYYVIFKNKSHQDKVVRLTKEEAENIIEKVAVNEVVDLRKMDDYVIIYYERWETVYIRNDINEFDDEDIPIVISVSKD